MAAQSEARLQELQRMNAAAKESVNIFDKLFARKTLSEKNSVKLQNTQRQLHQELADQERKLAMGSPVAKLAASYAVCSFEGLMRPRPAPSRSRLSLDFGSPSPLPNGTPTQRKEPPKTAPRTPSAELNLRPPTVPKSTPKSSSLKPPAASRRASELRRESERFGSSPVTSARPKDEKAVALTTPKKLKDEIAPPRPSPSPIAHVTPSRSAFAPEGSTAALTLAARVRPVSVLPSAVSSSSFEDDTSRASKSTSIVELEAENRRLLQAEADNKRLLQSLRALEGKYERLRLQHRELLNRSLEVEEQLVTSEAEKVSIIAMCIRTLKESGTRSTPQALQETAQQQLPVQSVGAPSKEQEDQKEMSAAGAAEDSGWLDGDDVQESLRDMPGADITVPEQQ